jgi:hypothetical protein
MLPNDWDHEFRPRIHNRVPAVHGLDLLRWGIMFIIVAAIVLYAIAQ